MIEAIVSPRLYECDSEQKKWIVWMTESLYQTGLPIVLLSYSLNTTSQIVLYSIIIHQ